MPSIKTNPLRNKIQKCDAWTGLRWLMVGKHREGYWARFVIKISLFCFISLHEAFFTKKLFVIIQNRMNDYWLESQSDLMKIIVFYRFPNSLTVRDFEAPAFDVAVSSFSAYKEMRWYIVC